MSFEQTCTFQVSKNLKFKALTFFLSLVLSLKLIWTIREWSLERTLHMSSSVENAIEEHGSRAVALGIFAGSVIFLEVQDYILINLLK